MEKSKMEQRLRNLIRDFKRKVLESKEYEEYNVCVLSCLLFMQQEKFLIKIEYSVINTDKHNKNIIFIETKSIKKKEFITLVYKAYSSYKEQLKTYIPAILKKQYCLKEKSYNIDKLAEIIMCATDEEWNLVKDTGIGFYIIDRTM